MTILPFSATSPPIEAWRVLFLREQNLDKQLRRFPASHEQGDEQITRPFYFSFNSH